MSQAHDTTKKTICQHLNEAEREIIERQRYSSGGGTGCGGELLERSSPHPSRTFKTGIVYDSKRYSVIYLLSFFQRSQRC